MNPTKLLIRLTALLLSSSVLLSGCQQGNTRSEVEDRTQEPVEVVEIPSDPIDITDGLSPTASISLLLNTAESKPVNEAFELRRQAVELSIQHESLTTARSRLQKLENQYPTSIYETSIGILQQRLLLSENKSHDVLTNIELLSSVATPQEKLQIMDLKADAMEQAGFPIESVQLRIELDQAYSTSDIELRKNNDRKLWHSLMRVSSSLISGHISEIPDTLSGWLELAYLSKQNQFNTAMLNNSIDSWVSRNTTHPANRTIIDDIKQRQIAISNHPQHIALVLPLSGPLQGVGQAIRDGFLASYLETVRHFGIQLKIEVYDTEGKPELAQLAINLANRSGAKMIVGPLDKAAVAAAMAALQPQPTAGTTAQTTSPQAPSNTPTTTAMAPTTAITESPLPASDINTPILALNQIPASALNNITELDIYEFSLAPEAEARQAAERASRDGREYAMVIVPEDVWGNRLYEAFATRYLELGGTIISEHRFKRGISDHSQGIQQGINLDLSKQRHRQIKQLLNEDIEFTPRPRRDMDMIFMVASSQEARQIKPQLKFFYANHVPVYATSHIYSGTPLAARDKDLEGIYFADMPWVLNEKPAPNSLNKIVNDNWPQSTRYGRFYALGADAFRLLPQLEWLSEHPTDSMSGDTGRLSLRTNGVVHRETEWAVFRNGIPTTNLTIEN